MPVKGISYGSTAMRTRRFSARGRVPALLCLAVVTACSTPDDPDGDRLAERVGLAMGSELKVQALTSDPAAAGAAFAAVFAEFDRLDASLSVWKDGSDVLRVNAAAGVQPVSVGSDLIEVLTARALAQAVAQAGTKRKEARQ